MIRSGIVIPFARSVLMAVSITIVISRRRGRERERRQMNRRPRMVVIVVGAALKMIRIFSTDSVVTGMAMMVLVIMLQGQRRRLVDLEPADGVFS